MVAKVGGGEAGRMDCKFRVVTYTCDPMDYSLPGSPVHGIFQVRVLEWVAISFFRGSSQPMD